MSSRGTVGDIVEVRRFLRLFSCEWRIPDFPSLAGEGGDRYESPLFSACGGKWRFDIHPYGISRNPPSPFVNLILYRLDPSQTKTFRATLGIRGPEGVENERRRTQEFSNQDYMCSWSGFCRRSKLAEQNSRLMPGNMLTLTLNMKMDAPCVARAIDSSTQTVVETKETEVLIEENQTSEKQEEAIFHRSEQNMLKSVENTEATLKEQGLEELRESMKRLLASGKDTDVVVRVQAKEFPAHRLLLQARSPVFEAMFSHDMVEKLRGIVTMEDCDQETFPDFLEHVYTGSVDMISTGNVFSLYTASDKYDLKTLKKACAEFVKKNLTVATFCDAITLAIKYDEKELIELATEFFCSNLLEICKTVEWQIFLKENTTAGNELFMKAFAK